MKIHRPILLALFLVVISSPGAAIAGNELPGVSPKTTISDHRTKQDTTRSERVFQVSTSPDAMSTLLKNKQ